MTVKLTKEQVALRRKYGLDPDIVGVKRAYVAPEEPRTRPGGSIASNGVKAVDAFGKYK